MDIHTVTSSGGHGRDRGLSDLYREMDRFSNEALEGEKREAASLLRELANGADPREIQERIDALFAERRGELKRSLLAAFPRLSRGDVESYLNEWAEAWSTHFHAAKLGDAVRSKAPSPMELFASGGTPDPKLETALAQALSWQQSLSGSPDTGAIQLANDLVNEIEGLIASGGSIEALQSWTHDQYYVGVSDFLFDTTKYSGMDEADVTTWFRISQMQENPIFSQIDGYASKIVEWKYEGTCADPQLIGAAIIELDVIYLTAKQQGKPIDYGALLAQFQDMFVNSTFGGYPQMLGHPDQVYRFMQIFGLSMNSGLAIAEIEQLPQTAVTQAALKLLSEEPFPEFVQWAQNLYWNFPGLSQADATPIYYIAMLGAAPGPSPWDLLHDEVLNWANSFPPGSPDAQLAKQLLDQMNPNGSQSDLANWIATKFPPEFDIYMKYPDALQSTIQQLYSYAGVALSGPTPMDMQYKIAYDWQPTSDAGKELKQSLLSQMIAFHSNGPFSNVTLWAQVLVDDDFQNYPGLSAADAATFEAITKTSAPANPFASIQSEISQYLADRNEGFQNLLSHFGLSYPKTAAQWQRLLRMCQAEESKLQYAMQACHSPADWSALATHFHLPQGSWQQIQQEANDLLTAMQGAGGYQSAVSLFNSVLAEITALESEKPMPRLSALQDWAKGVNLSNYPGLTANDLAEFQKLI